METISILQKFRFQYSPKLPAVYENGCKAVALSFGEPTESIDNQKELKEIFGNTYGKPIAQAVSGENPEAGVKRRVGVVLSGGQAPGGHNVIAGIFDALKDLNADSELLGFLKGPAGILDDKKVPLTRDIIDTYRNTGGFDMIGSGRTKIEKENQFARALEVCQKSSIDALVIIGGDDSNTNAALLAEYFVEQNAAIQVIGIPKTIDGDLKNEYIETSFGFDTATKTYSELIGNIERDANSAKKYWHFIKLMGRSASHICLECALQVRPNVAVISEEVNEKKTALNDIVEHIAEVVKIRSEKGENFGVVLVPEGLIEFIPEVGTLIRELNDLLAGNESYFNSLHTFEDQSEWVNKRLSKDASYVFSSLPNNIQRQLLMDRDPHGNVQVSRIETEKLLIEMVDDRLNEMRSQGVFQGKFSTQSHFFGYEGRCAFPSNFDADYCYSLGYNALVLIANGLTGYISSVQNLAQPAEEWIAGGIPITMMMNLERRHGNDKPVIKKALVKLDGKPFQEFASYRDEWSTTTSYTYPGAIQYYGPKEICDKVTETIRLESEDRSES